MNRNRTEGKEGIGISNKTINQKQMKENKRERKTYTDCGGSEKYDVKS